MKNQIFFVIVVGIFGILAIPLAINVSFASLQDNSSTDSTNETILPNGSSTHFPVGPTLDHINQAQAALQNGDIEGANKHLDLAKESIRSVCLSCLG